jgi:H+/Cl- antiporter ClcA
MFDDLKALSEVAIAAETPRDQTRIVVVGLLAITGVWMAILAVTALYVWWFDGVSLNLWTALAPIAPSAIFAAGFLLWRRRARRRRASAPPPLQLD